jgi:hypothetical protein
MLLQFHVLSLQMEMEYEGFKPRGLVIAEEEEDEM